MIDEVGHGSAGGATGTGGGQQAVDLGPLLRPLAVVADGGPGVGARRAQAPLTQDAVEQAHRLTQYGAGRRRDVDGGLARRRHGWPPTLPWSSRSAYHDLVDRVRARTVCSK